MSATIEDLTRELEEFFARRFPSSGGEGAPGSVLLVFDQLGRSVPAINPTSTSIAQQLAAQWADQLPAGNALKSGWYLPRSGSRLSTWYGALLEGAKAVDDDLGDTLRQRQYEAQRKFDLNELIVEPVGGVAVGAVDTYYATNMMPADWFAPEATCWTGYRTEAPEEPAPAEPHHGSSSSGSVVDSGPVTPHDNRPWIRSRSVLLRTTSTALIDENPGMSARVAAAIVGEQPTIAAPTGIDEIGPAVTVDPSARTWFEEIRQPPARDNPRRWALEHEIRAAEPTREATRASDLRQWALTHLVDSPASETVFHTPETPRPRSIGQLVAASNFDPLLIVSATDERPVTSNSFSASFKYCMVTFSRPWWDEVFINSGGWRLPGYEAASLSSGSMSEPRDPVTLITAGMILIKDLVLKASWSAEDFDDLPNAVSLGPFSLADANLPDTRTGSLECPGIQAIAWICEVPPILPPIAH